MKSVSMRSPKSNQKAQALQQQLNEPSAQKPSALPLSPCEDLHALIAKRAYELYSERGGRNGSALDDWLDAEREILSQVPLRSR
jgi:hypothetical protein